MKRISLLVLILIFGILAGALCNGSEIIVEPEQSWTLEKTRDITITPALSQGIEKDPSEIVSLEPIDVQKLLLEDKESRNQDKRPLRIGVHRVLPEILNDNWRVVSDEIGQYAVRLIIHSPGAAMIRPHFKSIPPEVTAIIYLYGEDKKTVEGPIKKPSSAKTENFWGPPIRGEYCYIECIFEDSSSVLFPVVDKISHVYRDVVSLGGDKVGDCHNDITCRSDEIRERGNGIAQIIFEVGIYSITCSGCLLNDVDSTTQIPWFLTANHCEIDEDVAPTAAFYFRYQTPECNGTPPSRDDTPRTDGAEHIVSYEPSDFTLLRLLETAPTGSTFCGWRASYVGSGIETYCIHHPDFSYKRINDGETIDYIAHVYDEENHITNRWTSGATEGGSSGSPLFDGQYVIGQLHGGPGSCTAIGDDNRDYYGRFSVAWDNGLSIHLGDTSQKLTLIKPNGGEIIPSGSPYTIEWDAPSNATRFTLKLSTDSGKTWRMIEDEIIDTRHEWDVPTPIKNKANCLVKLLAYDAYGKKIGKDSSDSPFTIEVLSILSPMQGDILYSGATHDIEWLTNGTKNPVEKVILKYSKNSGRTWKKIGTIEGDDPEIYGWAVPDVRKTKGDCRIKIVLKDANKEVIAKAKSDDFFTIGSSHVGIEWVDQGFRLTRTYRYSGGILVGSVFHYYLFVTHGSGNVQLTATIENQSGDYDIIDEQTEYLHVEEGREYQVLVDVNTWQWVSCSSSDDVIILSSPSVSSTSELTISPIFSPITGLTECARGYAIREIKLQPNSAE